MQPAPTVRPPHDRRLINRTCWQKWKIQHFCQQKCKYITYKGSEKPGCWRFFAHLKICQQISMILLANLRNITIIATFDKIRRGGAPSQASIICYLLADLWKTTIPATFDKIRRPVTRTLRALTRRHQATKLFRHGDTKPLQPWHAATKSPRFSIRQLVDTAPNSHQHRAGYGGACSLLCKT